LRLKRPEHPQEETYDVVISGLKNDTIRAQTSIQAYLDSKYGAVSGNIEFMSESMFEKFLQFKKELELKWGVRILKGQEKKT